MKLLLSLNVVGFGLVLFLTQFFATEASRGSIVGWICLVFSLCVFVAPLGVVVSTYLHVTHIYTITRKPPFLVHGFYGSLIRVL